MLQIKEMSLPELKYRAGGFIETSSGTPTMPVSRYRWFSFLKRHLSRPLPRHLHLRSAETMTDRDRAISLARLVLQKQKLGISLAPSQSLLLSRELLLAVKYDPK
jgi:hypothetical protein